MKSGSELAYELATHTLDNGLEVCVQPDPMAPAVAVNIWYEVGSYDETAGLSGFAHLFEHLMFQGSAGVASGEHMAVIEAAGGSVNATTSTDRTNYFETVPAGALDLALWLEGDRMDSLAITSDNFDAQREVVKEEKRQRYDNQPYGDLLELLVAQHFTPDHPYGHLPIGSMEDLDAASLTDVQQFFDAWYRASNARLVLSGNVDVDRALELAQKHFGALPQLDKPSHLPSAGPNAEARSTTVVRDVPHSLLYASWPTPQAAHTDHLALDLALSILTDGHTSRLHRKLVKQDRVAEEVHSATLPHLRDVSLTTVLLRPADGTTTADGAKHLQEEIAGFASDGPTDEEVQRAVAQYERDWLLALGTVESRADSINDAWLTFGDPARINTRLAELTSVTAADIAAAAAKHIATTPSELHYLNEDGNR